EQALPAGAGAVVACDQLLPFDRVTQGTQGGDELAPGAPAVALVRHQLLVLDRHALAARCNRPIHFDDTASVLAALGHKRSPSQNLPYVLHREDAWRGVGS